MKGQSRTISAVAILVAWVAGVGMLVRREFFRPHIERLAEAALRVNPGAVFYAVLQGDRQVGFASSTVDTSLAQIEQRDYLVADIAAGGRLHRATARTNVTMTRTLRVRTFDVELEADQGPVRVQGRITGDTLLDIIVAVGAAAPETASTILNGPILLPSLVPLAVALDSRPRVGKNLVLPMFDPASLAPRDVNVEVRAESLFVVNDSSVFDTTSGRWRGVLPVEIRAWQLVAESGSGVGGWVDETGRLVAATQMGFRLERRPYEVAYENWRIETEERADSNVVESGQDVLVTTAIASDKRLRASLEELTVRLGGVPLRGFIIDGGRQRLARDNLLTIRRETADALEQSVPLVHSRAGRSLRPEPLLESDSPEIVALAHRIAAGSTDRRTVAERINRWVYDSLEKDVTIGIPSALAVLRSRRGDCNEHTQLYVALARAAGVPARIASGLVYVDDRFYYHAWPEVLLATWVAVDPTFGQFPADASHIRFVTGGIARQAELLRLVGGLTIDVIASR